MMRQQSHAAGTFPLCPGCNREPRHIHDLRRRPVGGHLLSCGCGDTAKFDSLTAAVCAWTRDRDVSMTVRPLPARGTVLHFNLGGAR